MKTFDKRSQNQHKGVSLGAETFKILKVTESPARQNSKFLILILLLASGYSAFAQTAANFKTVRAKQKPAREQGRILSPPLLTRRGLLLKETNREEAYRANNTGVALLEQYEHAKGVEQFERALQLRPKFPLAQINLAIALFNAQKLSDAKIAAAQALVLTPNSPQANYILGLIARTENQPDEAVAEFAKVLELDPLDVGANVNIGQIMLQQKQYDKALSHLQTAYNAEPYNTSAIYNLAAVLQRTGERERTAELLKKFQTLRENGAGTSIGLNYLEQGRYAEAVASTGAESELVEKTNPNVFFQNAEIGLTGQKAQIGIKAASPTTIKPQNKYQILQKFAGGAALFDFDNDGSLDLVKLNNSIASIRKLSRTQSTTNAASSISLYRNVKGKFVDATRTAGDLSKIVDGVSTGIVAGDFDNDGLPDLFVLRDETISLYRNEGNGKFKDVSVAAKLPKLSFLSISCAFVDVDHDGDLDIFIGSLGELGTRAKRNDFVFPQGFSATNMLLRNNGDGTFTDISAAAKINLESRAVAVVPTDFDNRRDIDLLVLNYGEKPALLRNLRDKTFRNVADEVGLNQSGNWTCAAVGDFNKDTFVDFFFGRDDGVGVFATSDGQGKFQLKDAPAGTEKASAAQFLDYDNDGLLDLIVQTDKGLVLSRNLGDSWAAADSAAFKIKTNGGNAPLSLAGSRQIIAGDIDRDGDIDLLTFARNGSLQFLRNEGGSQNHSEILSLRGRVSNKTGVGAKIDLRAGSLTQKLESYSASPMPAPSEVHFGLGKRLQPDAVRVIWTSGIVQTEIENRNESKNQVAQNRAPAKIEELDRKPSSCPYLYTWNGEKFEFITDFMGGGEMGDWTGTEFSYPDPEEYVRIASDKLKPRDGRYEIRVTNELEEVLFVDRLELLAVDHPSNTEVYPNEGLGIPNADKFILYTTRAEHAPLAARDGYGNNVLAKITNLDRNFYDTFKKRKIRGYAEPHELTLTLDDKNGYNGRTLLLLTGWTDYAFSSDNVAAAQQGLVMQYPNLQVKDKQGAWQTVIDSIGFAVGRPQTMVVDLTGKFLSDSREVRILTTMQTYWDKIAVDTSADASANLRVTTANPVVADLRERGFSKEVSPDGKEPFGADYDEVNFEPKWKYFAGTFTRLGDVKPLLKDADDVFIVSKTGDEIILSFDVAAFPALAPGMKRTFLLRANGYSKEMDINSGSPEAVYPLPFHKMTKYPYDPNVEKFPMTAEKQKIYEEYLTRSVRNTLPRIDLALRR